ncbi:MAG: alpha/beta hydrolase [Clostridia bacterium]|nr:alpha/beta hydrolase [Clostridia bacterium]
MNININGMNVNYIVQGVENEREIILLHGWGANIKTFGPVYQYLSCHNKVYAIDMPGFGKSDEPSKDYHVIDYAKVILEFMNQLKIKNPVLVGHSFGGRVIMKLVGELGFTPKSIILVDSAGIKPKRKPSYYFRVYSYKFAKNTVKLLFKKEKAEKIISDMRKKKGSTDYRNASDTMKSVFINVVNEDLRYTLPNIKSPTLIIWGENDLETPLKDAKIMERLIPDSGLVILKGAGHYSYLDNLNEFLIIVDHFLKGCEE